LVNNVVDFSKITTKTLKLDEHVFDLRRMLEKLIQDFSIDAHQQGVELYYFFDPEMPLRARGDAARLNQILSTLLNHALKNSTIDHVFVEARFNLDAERDDLGELQIIISDSEKGAQPTVENDPLKDTDEKNTGIALSICKGLAACMGGSVNILENKERGNRVFINVQLQIVSHLEKRLGAEGKLRGNRILLIDLPEYTALMLSEELNFWGMKTAVATGYDQALQKLQELSAKSPLDMILIYTRLNNMNGLTLSKEIASDPRYAELKQIIVMSILQSDTVEMRAHLQAYPHISVIEKPIMAKRLYDVAINRLLNQIDEEEDHSQAAKDLSLSIAQHRILLVEDHRVDQMVISAMLRKMGHYVHIASNGTEALQILEREKFSLVLMDYDAQETDSLFAAQEIRTAEKNNHVHKSLPIIAVTSGNNHDDQAKCMLAGMDDQVAKPIRYDELENRLERWLK
jgi:CheY-like chemotaxis protein